MDIRILDNHTEIVEAFTSRFVLSWEEFQIRQSKWIAEMAKTDYPIDKKWYQQAYRWDRMDPKYPSKSMREALDYLLEHNGPVLFISEKGEKTYFQGKKLVDFVAEADAHELAARIEQEWFDSYRLGAQNMYDPDAFLPEGLYVFDVTMKWCAVFTHETTDWESEIDDPMKAAQSRVCIICERED